MGVINVLDPQVANLIAAGEVVDRPASVIKELLENAIDAGAHNITVEIKRGGITFIRVSDDGCGMSREDVPICIKRHATSKIRLEGDLDSIITLGFRGEALAAIGSVSTLRIMTKPHKSSMGTVLTCVGGEIREIIESGCPVGTTIIVEELFANVPARRKFLKKDASEALACAAVVEKIALSRPDISIKFITDGILKFNTSGDNKLQACIYAVLGRDFAKKLVQIHGMTGGIEVSGYVGTPENIRANRNHQNFFINGRYVKSRTAMAALEQAFNSYIPSDKFPVCVLELKIHPALVDVNVHPAKLEVKFSNEQAVFDSVYSAVRSTLESKLPRPEFSLKTKSEVTKEARIISAFVPLKDSQSDTPTEKGEQLSLSNYEKLTQAVSDMHLYNVHSDTALPKSISGIPLQENSTVPLPFSTASDVDSDINFQSKKAKASEREDFYASGFKPFSSSQSELAAFKSAPVTVNTEITTEISSEKQKQPPLYSVSTIPRQSATEEPQNVPDFKYIGEAFNSYVIVELDDTLLIIDKHAAHERILFEDMKKNITSEKSSQILLIPITAVLSNEELDAADTYKNELSALGFDFSISGNEVTITAVPYGIASSEASSFFITVCGQLGDGTGTLNVAKNIFFEQALYQASCKAAIKAGRIYDEAHLKWICKRVIADPAIRFCPHGRPVAFELTKNEIEHKFKRK